MGISEEALHERAEVRPSTHPGLDVVPLLPALDLPCTDDSQVSLCKKLVDLSTGMHRVLSDHMQKQEQILSELLREHSVPQNPMVVPVTKHVEGTGERLVPASQDHARPSPKVNTEENALPAAEENAVFKSARSFGGNSRSTQQHAAAEYAASTFGDWKRRSMVDSGTPAANTDVPQLPLHLEKYHVCPLARSVSRCFKWCRDLEEPERSGCLARVVESRTFKTFIGFLIMLNAIYAASVVETEMTDPQTDGRSMELEGAFIIVYGIECFLKIWVHRAFFFVNKDAFWNTFDFLLVFVAGAEHAWRLLADDGQRGSNLSFVRIARIVRFLIRTLRSIRLLEALEPLRRMLLAMADTLSSLFWCLVMLVFVFYVFGLLFMQGATGYMRETGNGLDDNLRQGFMSSFGSFSKTIYTMYYVCLSGDWSDTFSLVSTCGWTYSWAFIFFIGFYNFSVTNILTAMFVEQTIQTFCPDRSQAILEHHKKTRIDAEDFKDFCRHYDTSRSGLISYMDFQALMLDPYFVSYLATIGLEVKDAGMFFNMISASTGSTEVEIEDFVQGCLFMKGSASALDLQVMRSELKYSLDMHRQNLQAYSEKIDRLLFPSCKLAAVTQIS